MYSHFAGSANQAFLYQQIPSNFTFDNMEYGAAAPQGRGCYNCESAPISPSFSLPILLFHPTSNVLLYESLHLALHVCDNEHMHMGVLRMSARLPQKEGS